MSYGATALGIFTSASKEIQNDFCYELTNVVRAMMFNMVDGVTVGSSLGDFFDGVNPISGDAETRIFITPKSNVKVANFDTQGFQVLGGITYKFDF